MDRRFLIVSAVWFAALATVAAYLFWAVDHQGTAFSLRPG
jgi:hypothetical protein